MHRFDYRWKISDGYPAPDIKYHGCRVFSTFACGGGSSMGYKLAGYDVIGANDIDKKMQEVYTANHNPKHFILGSVADMKTMDLPEELFGLDVLDGSPPCSTFSVAGSREKNWKKSKKFREGQSEQILSDLFFEFIDVAERLQPKVIIAENVKGMLIGNAKLYTKEVVNRLQKIGYKVQVFLLNSATMGVPQRRERVFFICHRNDLDLPLLRLQFNEKPILFSAITINGEEANEQMTEEEKRNWKIAKCGGSVGKFATYKKLAMNAVANTIVASNPLYHPRQCRRLNYAEEKLIGSFPLDYNFLDIKPRYLIGMSVPPVMMANVAYEVYNQWLSKLNN